MLNESDSQNEHDDNLDPNFDGNDDGDGTILADVSNSIAQLPNGSEIVTSNMSIPDPVLAGRLLAQLHAAYANFSVPKNGDGPFLGFEAADVDNATLNLVSDPANLL